MRTLAWVALLAALGGWAVSFKHLPDPADPIRRGLLEVPPPGIVRAVAGFRNMTADLLYMRFAGYWGYQLTHGRHFQDMGPLLERITQLDPEFRMAYSYGWVALGDSGHADQAVRWLEEGARQHPDDFWYPYQAGLCLFFFTDDFERAARYFEQAARLPGAGPEPAAFAARMYEKATRHDLAIACWERIYRTTEDQRLKETARRSLERLGADRLLRHDRGSGG